MLLALSLSYNSQEVTVDKLTLLLEKVWVNRGPKSLLSSAELMGRNSLCFFWQFYKNKLFQKPPEEKKNENITNIQAFWGYMPSAKSTQVWQAVCTVHIQKKQCSFERKGQHSTEILLDKCQYAACATNSRMKTTVWEDCQKTVTQLEDWQGSGLPCTDM